MKRKGAVVRAEARHVEELIPRIPVGDNADMLRGWGITSEEAVRKSFAACEAFAILADGAVVGLFGCTASGNLWLIRGVGIESVAVQFIRQSKPYFDAWLALHGKIFSYFSKDYDRLLRFMAWSGFQVTDLNNGYVRCERCAQE